MELKWNWILKGAALCLIACAAYYLNQYGGIPKSLEAVKALGAWGPFLFIMLCIPAGILFVPSAVAAFAAGALFGLGPGLLFCLIGTGLGSLGAFLIGRYLARDWVLKKFAAGKKFQLLAEMVRRKGWKIVTLARLSPVFPFMIGNYAFGVTPISARSYLGASLLGSIPSASLYVYLGTLSRDLILSKGSFSAKTPGEWRLFTAGLAVTVLLTFYLMRLARNILREGEDQVQ